MVDYSLAGRRALALKFTESQQKNQAVLPDCTRQIDVKTWIFSLVVVFIPSHNDRDWNDSGDTQTADIEGIAY